MTSDGNPYARFRRALETGNEALVTAAALELPRIALDDALRICLVLRGGDPYRYERAAVRWLGRFALEAQTDVDEFALVVAHLVALCGGARHSRGVRVRLPLPHLDAPPGRGFCLPLRQCPGRGLGASAGLP